MIKNIIRCIYQAGVNLVHHDGIEHAGYMAFLSLLSLFPSFVFIVALAGFIGESEIGARLLQHILFNLPGNVSLAIEPRIKEIVSGPPQGLLTLAIVGAIWTASSSVEGLRTILNRVYQVRTPPPYIWRRLLSIGQFLILASIIIVTMLLLVVAPIIWSKFTFLNIFIDKIFSFIHIFKILNPFLGIIRDFIVGITLFLTVSAFYFILPNTSLRWFYVFPGALLVIILWFIGGNILSIYLGHFRQVNLIYGSLGGVIISLIFFYIINMIFIYGAEFNYLLGNEIAKKLNLQPIEEIE
jgi:membrane protein